MAVSQEHMRYALREHAPTDQVAEPGADPAQQPMFDGGFPAAASLYPQLRYMGNKYRLLPWIHRTLAPLRFDSALDAFAGSGSVGYLFKAAGKRVHSNDFLNLSATISRALIENNGVTLGAADVDALLVYDPKHRHFIEQTFTGIFFTVDDLRFLDRVSWNIRKLPDPHHRAIAIAALIRSCAKRQPRGVFTVAGDPEHYKDDRRDLKLSLHEHFLEQVSAYNDAVIDNGQFNSARCGDVFDWQGETPDLVYMDPPYVPRADDNCYIKRYHFLEGLSCYWDGLDIMESSRVKKLEKRYTPFSYRRTAVEAFDQLFRKFADSTLVLSYSSNGYPDLAELRRLMGRYKRHVDVAECSHRYHFGTHAAVKRASVQEYLIIGT
jgi:DNA adenine methylase/adenine-specific DNA-methyltransferase